MSNNTIMRCFYCHEEMVALERCEECQNLFCDECAPYRDDDAPITVCLQCASDDDHDERLQSRINTALSYIRQHKDAGNNATLFHLARIENILLGQDDGLPTNAEGKGDG